MMNDSNLLKDRPFMITAICIVGLINATQMVNLITSPMSKQLGASYPLYFTFSVALSLGFLVGIWLLKRWAAFGYALVLICNQLVLLKMGYWELSAAVIPIVIVALLFHFRNYFN